MTKIKNTKKGMAKKTLSISLAVAMLATSNVPVWAAEFTDGTDAAFTSEAAVEVESPVVEEETVAPDAEASQVVEAGDLIIDELSVDSSTAFETGSVAVSGKIKYKKNGEVKELTKYKFGWRVAGTEQNIFTDWVDAKKETGDKGTAAKMAIKNAGFGETSYGWNQGDNVDWAPYVGKTLELVVFNNEEDDEIRVNPTVVGRTIINARDLTGSTLRINKEDGVQNYTIEYNGKAYRYTENYVDENSVSLNEDD